MIVVKLMGGLGNHMFIYAYARALSLKYNISTILYDSQLHENKHGNDSSLHMLNIDTEKVSIISEEQFKRDYKSVKTYLFRILCRAYKKIPYRFPNVSFRFSKWIQPFLNRHNIAIMNDGYFPIRVGNTQKDFFSYGYYQSEKFFKEYEETIKKELRVTGPVNAKNLSLYQLILERNSVCVHVRRGDYQGSKISDICDSDYFERAVGIMQKIHADAFFIVFSDGIKWAQKNIHWPKGTLFVQNDNYAHEDLQLMYHCKHFIISNSSFSWWAQYLADNKEKTVIAPKKWLFNRQKNDIYMRNWRVI